jgi:hypothetical protein
MATHDDLGPDDRDGLEDRWKPSIQLNEEQAISVRELDTTAHLPLQHDWLMSEHRVLCLKSALRLERRLWKRRVSPEIRIRSGAGGKKARFCCAIMRSVTRLQCIADNQSNSSITDLDLLFDAHFDSRATMLADNPKVENLTTSDGFLIAD